MAHGDLSNDCQAIRSGSISRRNLLQRVAAIGLSSVPLLGLLAGCGGGQRAPAARATKSETEVTTEATGSPSQNVAASPASNAVRGGTITIGMSIEPANLGAQLIGNTQEMPVAAQLYDSLMKYTPQLELSPHICTSYEVVSPTAYRFKIRQDVKFHNGRAMTAEDVRYSLLRAKDPNLKITRRLVEMIDTVSVDDPQTVTVSLSKAEPLFLHWVSAVQTAMVPKEVIDAEGDGFARRPVGTGPFKFDSWQSGSRITLSAFDDYFLGRPYLDSVVYRIVPDSSVVALELTNGTIDIAPDPEILPEVFPKIASDSKLDFGTTPQLNYWFFGMNCAADTSVAKRQGIFRDKRVRQAFYHGVDWDKVAQIGIGDPHFGSRNDLFEPKIVPWRDESHQALLPKPQHDVDAAKKLLADAGHGDGLNLEVMVWNDNGKRMAVPLQAELKNIGVNLSIQFYELATWVQYANAGNFDCYLAQWTGQDSADPYSWFYLQFNSASFGSAGNRARFKNDQIDQLLNAAQTESDATERIKHYVATEAALIPEIPQIPLWGSNAVIAWNKRVQGLVPDPLTSWSASIVRLWYPPYSQVWIKPA